MTTHLRECPIVPDVPMMRETVAHIAQPPLFDVLFDRIERFFLGDLHLCIGPAGNLNNHVEDAVVLVGEEGDVVK
jgi:hypothetical protein